MGKNDKIVNRQNTDITASKNARSEPRRQSQAAETRSRTRNAAGSESRRPVTGMKSPKPGHLRKASTGNNAESHSSQEGDENLIGELSQNNVYSIDDDELESEQHATLERLASVSCFRTINGSQLSELSTPELTWLSENLPGRYQYNRRPSRNFNRGEHIRFLLQLQEWMSANRNRRTSFDPNVIIINDGRNGNENSVERVQEDPPPRAPRRRNREDEGPGRRNNRQRTNNNTRVYFPSPDPAQEILSLNNLELGRLARRDTLWLAGLCASLIAKYPTLQMEFNDRDAMSVLSAASTIRGRLDHLRTPLTNIIPSARNARPISTPQLNSSIIQRPSLQVNHSNVGYPPMPSGGHFQLPVQSGSYSHPHVAAYPPPIRPALGLAPAYNQHSTQGAPYLHHANVGNLDSLGFQERAATPSLQSPTTWNGLPLSSPEEVGNYPGLGNSRPMLLVQARLGASILRQFLLDGQNIELFTRQRFADLRSKDREPSTQAFSEAVSLARTIHFTIHMFGDVATALRQCDALEISLRRLWVLVEVEQACFNGSTRKNAWKTFGVILEHAVHGQQMNSVVHQLMRRDFYTMEKFNNAVGRMRADPGGN